MIFPVQGFSWVWFVFFSIFWSVQAYRSSITFFVDIIRRYDITTRPLICEPFIWVYYVYSNSPQMVDAHRPFQLSWWSDFVLNASKIIVLSLSQMVEVVPYFSNSPSANWLLEFMNSCAAQTASPVPCIYVPIAKHCAGKADRPLRNNCERRFSLKQIYWIL